MPLISIITTFYNAELTLKKTVRSVLEQSFHDFEYILVDDGSEDKSVELLLIDADPRVHLLRPGRVGRSCALNLALKYASGKYIAIIDADDICLPERLSIQVALLEQYAGVTLVCSNAELIDIKGDFCGLTSFPLSHAELKKRIINLDPFPHSSVMYRKKEALEVGGYNERCIKSIDYNFYLSLLLEGYEFYGIEKALIKLRVYSKSWGKDDKNALQIRFGIIGLINFYQKQHEKIGILDLDDQEWFESKKKFDLWFDHKKYQQQIQAKCLLSKLRMNFRNYSIYDTIYVLKKILTLDLWFWRYRGCNFLYPIDVEDFLSKYLNGKSDK